MTPVTIGDQKFVKDLNKGWIDAKTKQPADKGLIRLLDSLVIDEPLAKKLRIKIDRSVEPISLNDQKFVYDTNQGWIDEKSKIPVPPHMQTILNAASKPKVPDVSDSMGIVGKAAQQTKAKPRSGGGTLVNNRNTTINKPLVAMINQLASIDGFLKQRLDNQKIVAKNNLLAIRESQIEATDQAEQMQVIQPDAEKVGGSSAGLVALGGLALLTLDPVQEAIKDIAHGVVETGKFITAVVSTINKAFTFLFSGKPPADAVPAGESGTTPTPVAEPTQDAGSVLPATTTSVTPEQKPSFFSDVTAGAATGAVVGSIVPRVGMVAGAAIGGAYSAVTHFTSGGSTTPATSGGTTAPIAQATKTGGSSATSAGTSPAQVTQTDATAAGEIPKNNIVALGNYLASKGADKSKMEHMALSGRVGEHSQNSRHYRGAAIDVNFATDEAAKLDALAPQLKAAGYNVIWRAKDHYDHMHVSVGGPEGGGGGYGDSNGLMGIAGQAVEGGLEKMAELFGILGSAIIKPGVPRDKEDYSKAISAAAVKTNADVAVTKTPKSAPIPKAPTPPNINKIDGGATQNPATSADKNSVYYYLRRFGYQDLSTPVKALTTG